MKITYRTADGRLCIEFEASSQTQAWATLASTQEVFESSKKCGCCGCPELRYVLRRVDEYNFYELHCTWPQCRARKSFGVSKVGGTLFPHRKDADGNYLPNNGWIKWEGATDGAQRSDT